MTGYSSDLAYVHDIGFSDYAVNAAPGLLGLLRRNRITSGHVIDLGCGSGVWAARLLGEGYRVTGVDISPSMIRLARKAAPGARFVAASMLSYEVPPCDAVTSLGECINYCFDPANSPSQIRRLFARVYAALRPGGLFIFDFAEPGQVPPGRLRRAHALGEHWAVLVEAEENRKAGVVTRRITSFRRVGGRYRRTDETHIQKVYKAADVLRALERIGFKARASRKIGAFPLPPEHVIVTARRPPL